MTLLPLQLFGPFDSLFVGALASTLLHFLWQGCLIGLVYALLDALMKRSGQSANSRYALAVMTQCALLATPVIWFSWTLSNAATAVTPTTVTDTGVIWLEAAAASALGSQDPASVARWTSWVVIAWAAGVLCYGLRLMIGALGLWRLGQQTVRPSAAMQATLERLADTLGIRLNVTLKLCRQRVVPATYGVLRPVVLVPLSVLTQLERHQLELILLHELAHIRRFDYLVNLVQLTIEALLFYHPVVHWVGRRARIEREHACDDLVLRHSRSPVAYARALTEVETLRQAPPAMAANNGDVISRVKRLLAAPTPPKQQRGHLAGAMILVALLTGSLASAVQAPPEPADKPTSQAGTGQLSETSASTEQGRSTDRPAMERTTRIESLSAPVQSETAIAESPAEHGRESPPLADTQALDRPPPNVEVTTATPANNPKPSAPLDPAPDDRAAAQATASDSQASVGVASFAMREQAARSEPTASVGEESTRSALLDEDILASSPRMAQRAEPLASIPASSRPLDNLNQTIAIESAAPLSANLTPRVTKRVEPEYPSSALRRGEEGWVRLSLRVNADGRVEDVSLLESSNQRFDFTAAAAQAARQWQFEPKAFHQGSMVQTFEFAISDAQRSQLCRARTGTRLTRC